MCTDQNGPVIIFSYILPELFTVNKKNCVIEKCHYKSMYVLQNYFKGDSTDFLEFT